jgi:TatD DNase family protein
LSVFHCFNGTLEQAKKIIALGFYLGIGGVATFKNSGLDNVIPELELSKLLLETDSPYLAPVPHRGKRNEPSYLPIVAEKIALLKKVALNELEITTKNADLLFNLTEQTR